MDPTIEEPNAKKPTRRWLKMVVLILILGGLAVASIFLPVKDDLIAMLEWTQGLGFWAPFFVAAFYILACVLLLPGGVITLAAGFLFGVVTGTITVSVGSTLGSTAAFLVGRTFARDWVRRKVAGRPKFAAIDRAVGEQGFKIVLLTRLSPIFPFNMQNYAYGLTGVKLWKYMLASWIGMLPGTLAYVYIGSGLRSLTEVAAGEVEGGWVQRAFFWGGLAATLVVMVVVTRIAQKAMKRAVPNEQAQAETKEPGK
ncbi:MAG: TVP38/TMEM64 family protein [Phycisphaerae bacterium]